MVLLLYSGIKLYIPITQPDPERLVFEQQLKCLLMIPEILTGNHKPKVEETRRHFALRFKVTCFTDLVLHIFLFHWSYLAHFKGNFKQIVIYE